MFTAVRNSSVPVWIRDLDLEEVVGAGGGAAGLLLDDLQRVAQRLSAVISIDLFPKSSNSCTLFSSRILGNPLNPMNNSLSNSLVLCEIPDKIRDLCAETWQD